MSTSLARDLALPSNVLSLLRVPLAAAFPFAARRPRGALVILALAGLTDVLDGWLARHQRVVSSMGAVVDPVADKVFAMAVVSTLVAQHKLPRWGVAALLARELLEAPLVAWVMIRRHGRGEGPPEVHANLPGKLATIAQFGAVLAALTSKRALPAALGFAAVTAGVAGIAYWRRELDREEHASNPELPAPTEPAQLQAAR